MEPNKVDKKFRSALQKREITPTPAAWDRLDAMLTVVEEKKATPTYNWLYIAATIVGFIAITLILLSKTQTLEDVKRDEIVYENATPVQSKDSLKNKRQTEILPHKSSAPVAEVIQKEHTSTQIKYYSTNLKNNLIEDKQTNQNQIANQRKPIINQKTEQPDQLSNPIEIANQQQIAILEANTKLGKTPIKVNASSLLSEVDGELELSFREKVINKIDKNYKTVKVALANRNQQSINQ